MSTARPATLLAFGPLVGCATLAACVLIVGCTSPTAPLPEGAPSTLEFGSSGYGALSTTWKVRGDTVLYFSAQWDEGYGDSLKVVPTAEEWRTFWAAADEAGVRRWRGTYAAPHIVDGLGWNLRLGHGRLLVIAQGSNAFPDRHGRKHEGDTTPEFRSFTRALYRLIGFEVLYSSLSSSWSLDGAGPAD